MSVRYNIVECNYRFGGRREVSRWIGECVESEGCRLGEVNIIFCADDYLLEINRSFLKHDYYTDVITFQYGEDGEVVGDIYISVDTVASNADKFGQSRRREMLRVMIHGILHLCGYGDKTDEEEIVMRSKEDFYLDRLELQ